MQEWTLEFIHNQPNPIPELKSEKKKKAQHGEKKKHWLINGANY